MDYIGVHTHIHKHPHIYFYIYRAILKASIAYNISEIDLATVMNAVSGISKTLLRYT